MVVSSSKSGHEADFFVARLVFLVVGSSSDAEDTDDAACFRSSTAGEAGAEEVNKPTTVPNIPFSDLADGIVLVVVSVAKP